jgi:hypothetical protein
MPSRILEQTFALALLWIIIFALTLPMNSPSFAALLVKFKKGESVATVTREADPKNHRYLTYQYVIDGKTFSGVGYGPNGKDMRVGEQVRVCYFPAHPQYATIATYTEQTEHLRDGVMSGLFMATLGTFIVYWKYFRTGNYPASQAAQLM